MSMEDRGEERLHPQKVEEALEVQSLRRIISAYLNYSDAAEKDVRRYERSYRRLSPAQKGLISHFPSKFQKLRRCIFLNTIFINNMLQAFEPPIDMSLDLDVFEHPQLENPQVYEYLMAEKASSPSINILHCRSGVKQDDMINATCMTPQRLTNKKEVGVHNSSVSISGNSHIVYRENSTKTNYCSDDVEIKDSNGNYCSSSHDWLHPSLQLNVPLVDDDKVRCIIRNIVRDWAAEGQKERDQCYKPILEELDKLFPNRKGRDSPPACLVPGAGLGRLALEISSLGFISQGNEFSYYMMICSNFILNQAESAGEWIIYPWIHSNCNSLSDDDQLRAVSIPDIHPARDY